MELGLQLRHFYTVQHLRILKRLSTGNGKTTVYYEHCRTIPHFKPNHVGCLCLLVPWSLSPQLHWLCLLQVWRKWARSGRSIQARQSEWSMTVQYRRKLRRKQTQISNLLLISGHSLPVPPIPLGQNARHRLKTKAVTVHHGGLRTMYFCDLYTLIMCG